MKKVPLYERFAQELEAQIAEGTFREGSRIPSIREMSESRGISFSTVVQAYQVLDSRGILEARPQSGYFVRARARTRAPEPGFSPRQVDPTHVSIDEVSERILQDSLNLDYAQFGAAIPDPELLPTAKLNRILAALAREGRFPDSCVGPFEGREELRVQIARRAFSYGCDLQPDRIVITAGCTEAICLCLQAVCEPGDLVAIESPTYFGVLMALEAQHLRALEIPTHPRTGLSLEALRFALDNHPIKAVVAMTNFSNPTGATMGDDDKRELVALLSERGVPLIEDDINGELYFSERRPGVAKAYDEGGNVMLCSSFSKDISSGHRIGYVAPGRRFAELRRLKCALNVRTSVLPQLAIASFLESGGYDQHLRRIRRAYALKMENLACAVARHFPEGTRVAAPGGGFVLWVQLPGGLDSLTLYHEALRAFVTIAPGYVFSPARKFDDYVRMSAASWSEKSEGDLARLGQVAKR
ncbi:MAG: PLP-dependent aminotransferase family protein, partial [Spirochaetaceae bacterium]|nr:PLP-dependent aminotransferase family protein [Spirochaetaceae bacterium]